MLLLQKVYRLFSFRDRSEKEIRDYLKDSEKIDEIIEKKLNLSNLVLLKGELAITELNNEQLKELFSLRRDNLEV